MTTLRPLVLFVTAECHAPPRTGGALRTQRLVRALAEWADVRLLAVEDADVPQLRQSTNALAIQVHPRAVSPIRARLRAIVRRWPVPSARWWHPAVAAEVRREVARGTLVVLDHTWLAVYATRRGALVLNTHNVDSALQAALPRTGAWWRGLEQWWDTAMLRRLERRVAGRPDVKVVAVSEQDALALGRPDALVIENGTDRPVNVPPRPEGGRILFVGNMRYLPNRLAVRWWLDEVRGLLPASLPPLTVVGRGGREAFGGEEGLEVLDEVPDLGQVLAESRLVAVPLQQGGGSRLKVLEAMAWRRPVVSTSKGAEGLRARDGEHLHLADDPASFAAAVLRVYAGDANTEAIVSRAADLATTYDWHLLGRQFAAGLLEGRRG